MIEENRFIKQQVIQIGIELCSLLRKNGYENVEGTLWEIKSSSKEYLIEATAVRKGVYLPFSIKLNCSEAYQAPIGIDTVADVVYEATTFVQKNTLDIDSYVELQKKIIDRIQNLDRELREGRELRKEFQDD